jgi:hypothetical protein
MGNQASRTQMDGRINRLGQSAKTLDKYVVYCGVLGYILKHHNAAKSLELALADVSKTIPAL